MVSSTRNSETMINVLSIDIDFISNAFNSQCGITDVVKRKVNFVKKLIDKYKGNINYIVDHGDVAKDLFSKVNIKDVSLMITNIDHHHDIYYSDIERRDIDRLTHLNPGVVPNISLESDWIYWICSNANVVRVNEILNEDSSVSKEVMSSGARFYFNLGSPMNPYDLDLFKQEFDYIYIALSPAYVSPEDRAQVCELLDIDVNVFDKDKIKEMGN